MKINVKKFWVVIDTILFIVLTIGWLFVPILIERLW
jgi:hypothetical protein